MSESHQRIQKEDLIECANTITRVANHIPDAKYNHKDWEDLQKCVGTLVNAIVYLIERNVTKRLNINQSV